MVLDESAGWNHPYYSEKDQPIILLELPYQTLL